MRYRQEHTYCKIWLTGLTMVLCSLFVSCTKEEGVKLEIPHSHELSMVSFTRSSTLMTQAAATTVTEDYSPLQVFLVKNGTNENEIVTQSDRFIFRPSENLWKSKLEITTNTTYAIYGYAPADAVTAEISGVSLTDTSTGATLTFSNLPAVSSQDICFVVGVHQVTTSSPEEDPKSINVTKPITQGIFTFTGNANGNYAHLLLDHIYAGLCIQASIGTEYAQLRSIKIRKLELQASKATATATIAMASNTTGTSPVQSATYSNLTGEQSSAIFFDSTEGVELDVTTLREATCCFVPSLSNDLTLVTTYDVYDKKGNKIAERTATNKLPNLTAARGQRVNLALKIEPTYLGVLSDKDLDDPTVVVN